MWAYEAAAQLAAHGVIEGYGDGTYGGGRSSNVFAYLDGDQLTKMFYVGLDYNKSRNKGFFGTARYFRCTNGINFTDDKGDERSNHIWQAKAGALTKRATKSASFSPMWNASSDYAINIIRK